MKNKQTTTAPAHLETLNAADLYAAADIELAVALRAKHSTTGNAKIASLQDGRTADRQTRNAADIISEAGQLHAQAAEAIQAAKALRAYARQSGRTPAEAKEARANAAKLDKTADKLTKAAKALEDSTSDRTFTDHMPKLHDTICGHIAATVEPYVITPADIQRVHDKLTEATKAHSQHTAFPALNAARSAAAILEAIPAYAVDMAYFNRIFRGGTTAGNRAISADLAHNANNSTITRRTLATPETLAQWQSIHGENSGPAYKVYVDRENQNFYTLEYLKYKNKPSGFYFIYHQKTIAQRISLEAYTEGSGGDTVEIVTNGGIPFAETQEAKERIENLIESAEFTARERDFLNFFLTKAAEAGQEAVNAAEAVKVAARRTTAAAKAAQSRAKYDHSPETQKAAQEATEAARAASAEADKIPNDLDLIRYRAMVQAAAEHIGILTTSGRTTFLNRLKARAIEAARIEQGPITPEEAEAAEAKRWEQMQKNSRRGYHAAEAVTVLFAGIDSPDTLTRAAAKLRAKAKYPEDKRRASKAEAIARAASQTTEAAPVVQWLTASEAETLRAKAAEVDRSALPADWNARWTARAINRWAKATSPAAPLALPAAGESTRGRKLTERARAAAERHPNQTAPVIIPDTAEAAAKREQTARWNRYFSKLDSISRTR